MSTYVNLTLSTLQSNASRHWDGVVGTYSAHQHCTNDANDIATNDDLHWPVLHVMANQLKGMTYGPVHLVPVNKKLHL